MSTNKQLMLGDRVIETGSMLSWPDVAEGGVVVGIDYDLQEVYVTDCREGWTCSEENENLGKLKFVEIAD
jgi:hypothetical protein